MRSVGRGGEVKKGILGIDIGGTRIRMGMVGPGDILREEESRFIENGSGEHFLEGLFGLILAYMERTDCREELAAIAVGVPSTLSKDRAVVLSTPNIPALNNVRLKERMEERFRVPVFVERDVNFLLRYDVMHLGIPEESTVIACYIGTGIGNAIRINGKLLTGHNGVACELGHIPVFGNSTPCVCGNAGCIETIASGKYLTGLCERIFWEEDIKNVFVNHGESPEIHRFIEGMSIPVATEINILDPDHVIIGGGVPAMRGFPKEEFERRILDHIRKPLPARELKFLYSGDNEFNGVRGGGLYALEHLKGEKGEDNVGLFR